MPRKLKTILRRQATRNWDRIMRRQITKRWDRIIQRQLQGGSRRTRRQRDRMGFGEILADQLFGSYHND